MKVNIVTPIRPGGPYYAGKNLAEVMTARGIEACWTHALPRVLLSPVWQSADVVCSAGVPISYRLWRKPVVLTIHGEYTAEKSLWRRFFPSAIRMADVITTPSRFLRERLDLQDAVVIPNGVFPERFAQVRHSERDCINLVTVTSFGFEEKAKGVLEMLEVVNAVGKVAGRKIRYVVVGGGRYLERIKQQARTYNVDVAFVGMQPNAVDFLRKGDIFLYHSYHDNVPMVIQEAMACRLPVVTNEFGAAKELIEHGKDGYIGETRESYLEHVLDLLGNVGLRDNIGQNARTTVETKFDWELIDDQYIEVFRKLVGDSQGLNS